VDIGGGTRGLLWTARRETVSAETGSTVTLRFNRYNSRGDVVGQSDAAGVTTWAATYQADGRRTGEVGTNLNPKHVTGRVRELGVNRDRHRANTKEEDPTGLLNEGFRYRDMETGTFISRDPLGLVDGPNVYCYVRQNPWTMWDPEGLWAIADDAIAMGVGAVLGVAAQGVSDVWHGKLSGWEDYAASGVGGALAGEAALYTGGLASGAVYGASANLTRQGLRNLSGKQSGFDCNSLVAETAVCAVGGKLGEVAAPYLSRTVARAMQKESSVVAAGSTTALNAEVKATGDVLESTIAPAAEAGAANKPLMSSGGTWTGNTGGAGLKYNIKPAAKGAKIDVDALAKSAAEHDRKGLTRAGRAMDKHAVGQRGGTSPFPPLRGGVAEKNAMGQFQVEDMLTHPDAVFTPLGRGGLQVKLPDGRAMRFNADGRLAGFID
jgi:RHS repeat-associated protein